MDDRLTCRRFRCAQHFCEAYTIDPSRHRQPSHLAERGENVHRLHKGFGSRRGNARGGNQQRNARCLFVVGMLAPHAVIAQMPTMISPKDDDCLFGKFQFIKFIDHSTQLRIHVTGGGIVAVNQGALQVLRQGTLTRDVLVVPQLSTKLWRIARRPNRWLGHRGQGKFFRVMHVPVFLRCAKRQVWFHETDCQKKRRFRAFHSFCESTNGFGGNHAIGIRIIGNIGVLVGRPIAVLVALHTAIFGSLIHASFTARKMRNIPRCRIFAIAMSDVENFPHRFCAETLLAEMLRHGDRVWSRLAEIGAKIVDAQRLGSQSCHQCMARWRAHRLIAVCGLHDHRSLRQAIQVWSLCMRIAIAAQKRLEIIHANQQHIRFSFFRSSARENRETQHEESGWQKSKSNHATNTSDAAQKVSI